MTVDTERTNVNANLSSSACVCGELVLAAEVPGLPLFEITVERSGQLAAPLVDSLSTLRAPLAAWRARQAEGSAGVNVGVMDLDPQGRLSVNLLADKRLLALLAALSLDLNWSIYSGNSSAP